jgi:hypothetical protein
MSSAEENRFYDLLLKQKDAVLTVTELKELLRLAQKKAGETARLNQKPQTDSLSATPVGPRRADFH